MKIVCSASLLKLELNFRPKKKMKVALIAEILALAAKSVIKPIYLKEEVMNRVFHAKHG